LRFLIDAALSPVVAAGLRRAGHDAVHLVDYDMLLATTGVSRPSFVLVRHPTRPPQSQVDLLLASLEAVAEALNQGSIVALEESRLRIRRLPISESTED
jgi:predicted nuclease of predicted toxin-antitoxin system